MSGDPSGPDREPREAWPADLQPPDLGEPHGLLPEEPLPLDPAQYVFPHPQWSVGVVLVLAVVTLILGIFGHPVWLLIGAPFILTLMVWLFVRIRQRVGTDQTPDGDPDTPSR